MGLIAVLFNQNEIITFIFTIITIACNLSITNAILWLATLLTIYFVVISEKPTVCDCYQNYGRFFEFRKCLWRVLDEFWNN